MKFLKTLNEQIQINEKIKNLNENSELSKLKSKVQQDLESAGITVSGMSVRDVKEQRTSVERSWTGPSQQRTQETGRVFQRIDFYTDDIDKAVEYLKRQTDYAKDVRVNAGKGFVTFLYKGKEFKESVNEAAKGMEWDDAVEKAFGRDIPLIDKTGGINNEAGLRQLKKAGLEREEAYHIRDAARKATMDMIKKYDIPENKYERSNDNFYGVMFNVTAFDSERKERNFFREVIRQTKQYARQKHI